MSADSVLPRSQGSIAPGDVRGSLGRFLINDVLDVIPDLNASHDNYLVDSITGRGFLDCISYFASNPVGHNHAGMHTLEFEEKLLRAGRTKPANSDFYTVEMAEFVASFARLALPSSFKHLFFVEGGALAVENALKVAFDWKVRSNLGRSVGRKNRSEKSCSEVLGSQVMHFRDAFHGRSGYALSLTNSVDDRKTKYYPKFPWPRILNPKLRFPLDEVSLAEVQATERVAENEIRQAFEKAGGDIAAIIIEPIQGEGGDNHFRGDFLRRLRELADEYGAMLIFDEVQTGLGLTGRMWAHEHFGVVPDILCFGKKTQVCGIMVNDRVDQVPNNVFVESSRLNSTWGGSLVDMVRAQRYLEIIEQEQLVNNAAVQGEVFQNKLGLLAGEFPGLIGNARGRGLMCAFDLIDKSQRSKLIEEFFKEGLLVLSSGDRSVRFRPSLTWTSSNTDEAYQMMRTALLRLHSFS